MSTKHVGRYSDEEIEELRMQYSNEKVAAILEVAEKEASKDEEDLLGTGDDSGEGEGEEPVDYASKTVSELTELLKARDLSVDGLKADLVKRLKDDDASE